MRLQSPKLNSRDGNGLRRPMSKSRAFPSCRQLGYVSPTFAGAILFYRSYDAHGHLAGNETFVSSFSFNNFLT